MLCIQIITALKLKQEIITKITVWVKETIFEKHHIYFLYFLYALVYRTSTSRTSPIMSLSILFGHTKFEIIQTNFLVLRSYLLRS